MAVVSKGDRTLKLLGVCWEKGESEGTRWASSVPDGSLLRTCCGWRWVKSYSPVGVRLALGCVCGHRGRSAPEASPRPYRRPLLASTAVAKGPRSRTMPSRSGKNQTRIESFTGRKRLSVWNWEEALSEFVMSPSENRPSRDSRASWLRSEAVLGTENLCFMRPSFGAASGSGSALGCCRTCV